MTRKELNQLYYLDKELKRCEENLQFLRDSIHAKSPNYDGMPKASGGSSSQVEELVFRLIKAEESVEGYKEAILIRKARILDWLTSLDDIFLAQIVDCRCVKLMTWNEVAEAVGGNNTEDSVRMYFNRNIPKK